MKLTKKAFLYKNGIDSFLKISADLLEKHTQHKKRFLRANQKPFINSEISKSIMTRTKLRNCFLKNRSDENRQLTCKPRNECMSLLKKAKKDNFTSLNENHITENKCFCKSLSFQIRFSLLKE